MRLALASALLAAALAAGCASAPPALPPAAPADLWADDQFDAPAHRVDAAQVFALSPAMRRYLEVEIAPLLRARGRQAGLVEALHSRAHLRLDYDTERTRNAAEAFDARSGNCLSLVLMTAALAKHLELPVRYQALVGAESWSREGELAIVNGHVNITVARRLVDRINSLDPEGALRIDFGTLEVGRGAAMHTVAEHTIVAMFMNNRAAEALVRGELAQAYAYAREAAAQDAGYATAYNTLGVIYRQRGLAVLAQRAFAQALRLDADHLPALNNQALLFESQGRRADAAPLRARQARIEREPPFAQFDLGRAALARGDAAAAREHFARALKRDPDYHEFHFWMAQALAAAGDARGAARHLDAAQRNSTTRRDLELYRGKLARLKAAVSL